MYDQELVFNDQIVTLVWLKLLIRHASNMYHPKCMFLILVMRHLEVHLDSFLGASSLEMYLKGKQEHCDLLHLCQS
jgi:hypothetical protein